MAIPALVFNEPAVTGAVRVELHGDPARAGAQLGAARALLGSLRCMYGVNERVAAGEPGGFYARSVLLADGTRIEALTNHGLDIVRVYAPDRPAPAPRRPAPRRRRVVRKRVLGVGYYDNDSTSSFPSATAFFWREGSPPVPFGPSAAAVQVAPAAVAPTGVACGATAYWDNVVNGVAAWRWSAQDGYAELPGGTYAYASGISADGGTIVGGISNGRVGTAQPCYWRDGGGPHVLGAPPHATQWSDTFAEAASADGRVILGWWIADDFGVTGATTYQILLWTDGQMATLRTWNSPEPYVSGIGRFHLSDDGRVACWGEVADGFRTWRWTAEEGAQLIAADFTLPCGMSASGATVYLDSFGGGNRTARWTRARGAVPIEPGIVSPIGAGGNLIGEHGADADADLSESVEAFSFRDHTVGGVAVVRNGGDPVLTWFDQLPESAVPLSFAFAADDFDEPVPESPPP